MNNKFLIIYHKDDNDGVFSAAICKYYITHELNSYDIDCEGHDYQSLNNLYNDKEKFNNMLNAYEKIVMTDVSFNDWKAMETLYETKLHNFIWIDHHKPIIMESFKHGFNNANGIRDISHSAILNMWFYLYDRFKLEYKNHNTPELYRILSGWDSWTFEQEGYTNDFCYSVNLAVNLECNINLDNVYELVCKINDTYFSSSLESFNKWMSDVIANYEATGNIIKKYDEFRYEQLHNAYEDLSFVIDGFDRKCSVLFAQGPTNSKMFKRYVGTDIKNGIIFKHTPSGNYDISIYNIDLDDHSFNCGDFMKEKYKGGGHEGAAGATISEEKFNKILSTKLI